MREYTIKRINDASKNIDWESISALAIDNHQWLPPSSISACAKICYDDGFLYVRLTASEEHILKRFTGMCDPVSRDSCLEFFFSPVWNDVRYLNMEFNPNAAMYIGFGRNRYELVRQIVQDAQNFFKVECLSFDKGWGISYAIPFEWIRLYFPEFIAQKGVRMRANCYKCGDDTVVPHYISWNPISSSSPDFHRPQDFGCMIFE